MIKYLNLLLVFICTISAYSQIPSGFVDVKKVIPTAEYEIRYAGNYNFVGKPIDGYKNPVAILTKPAAQALLKAQQELLNKGYSLKIFDAYRPQRAVSHFMAWAKKPNDTLMKQEFYPDIKKADLFRLGFIASRSGHSRGSTIDLTLINCKTGKEVDMGGSYDFFGSISHHKATGITARQKENRRMLKKVMMEYGFRPYAKEWWHYTLKNEPYPNTYFNFVVE